MQENTLSIKASVKLTEFEERFKMRFVTIDKDKFQKFASSHPNKSFFQTTEIASLREKNGWTIYYFGVEEKGGLVAASFVAAKPGFLGKSVFYAPGGPLLDYENENLVKFFFEKLRAYVHTHNGYVLHIEPYYPLIERNRDGDVVENGYNHTAVIRNLKALGFTEVPADNPKYMFVLDIRDKTEEEIFSSFKQNTRNLVSRTKKKGIKVRELSREELPEFKKITESTSERRHFSDKTLEYYETMYDLFAKKKQVKFVVAEIEGKIISAGMFILYGDEVIYLFSGSDEAYMKEYNAQYAVQWYMIRNAIKNNYKRYNFYGIQGLPDPSKPGYGIYKFKKGFGAKYGSVVELLGAFEMSTSTIFYTLRHLLQKFRPHR